MQNKAISMVGMAIRAGKAGKGAFQAEHDVKNGHAALLVVAADASENTKKKFRNMARFYEVELVELASCAELGHMCQKETLAVLTIRDEQLKRAVQLAMQPQDLK